MMRKFFKIMDIGPLPGDATVAYGDPYFGGKSPCIA